MELVICNGRKIVSETRVRPSLQQKLVINYTVTDMQLMRESGDVQVNWQVGVSQPSRRNGPIFLFIYIFIVRTSCKCACAALYALLFIRNYFQTFTYFHTRHIPRDAPIDLASKRTLLHSTACAATFGD